MAYNSLLPPEMQPGYQQQYAAAMATAPDPVYAQDAYQNGQSQMTYYHEGQMQGSTYTPLQQAYVTPTYSSPNAYQQTVSGMAAQPTTSPETYQMPLANAQNFSSQPVQAHYNPQPFRPHVSQMMSGGIPPPYKPMPVLPPINSSAPPQHSSFSSPAVMQNPANFGQYTLEGSLEYGKFVDSDFVGSYEQIPDGLRRELEETYGVYPRTDFKIAVENGRYHLYATPNGPLPRGEALPPVVRPSFGQSSIRRSMGFPRQVFPRPITGFSEDYESVNLSRASNYHHPFQRSRGYLPSRDAVIVESDPYGYEGEVIMEDIDYPTPPSKTYADYVRSSRFSNGSKHRYRSPTRYTTRTKHHRSYSDGRRSYSDGRRSYPEMYERDSRFDNAIRQMFRA